MRRHEIDRMSPKDCTSMDLVGMYCWHRCCARKQRADEDRREGKKHANWEHFECNSGRIVRGKQRRANGRGTHEFSGDLHRENQTMGREPALTNRSGC